MRILVGETARLTTASVDDRRGRRTVPSQHLYEVSTSTGR